MASMGMLGAMSGAAGGMANVMMQEIESARQERLQTLKAASDRETNRIDAQDRHGYATTENEQRHTLDLDKQEKQHEFSLTELAARGAQEVETKRQTAAIDEGNEDKWTVEKDAAGNITGQTNNRGEWKSAGTTSGTAAKQPDKLVIAGALQEFGVDDQRVVNYILGEDSPTKVRNKLITELGKDSTLTAQDVQQKVDELMKIMGSGGAATPDPAADPAAASAAPPVPGAQKAPDGNWYVEQNGKYFRVDPN